MCARVSKSECVPASVRVCSTCDAAIRNEVDSGPQEAERALRQG